MAEYISREAVLKAFKLIAKNPNKDYQRGMQDAIDCLVPEVIADIPTVDVQPVDRWISVEDSLPEERKCVLVYDGGVCIAWRYKGEWESDDYTLATVAYWQPLPEPPNEHERK